MDAAAAAAAPEEEAANTDEAPYGELRRRTFLPWWDGQLDVCHRHIPLRVSLLWLNDHTCTCTAYYMCMYIDTIW